MSVVAPRQRGYALIELVIAVAISCLLAIWGASAWVQQAEDAAAQASGVWLLTLKRAVDHMLVRQADVLVGIVQSDSAATGYRDVWQPTVSELIQAGHLPKGFPSRPALGYAPAVRVFQPEGACLTRGCKIEALVWAQPGPEHAREAVSTNRLGKLLMALEGVGASVHPLAAQRIKGPLLDRANPPGPEQTQLPVGTIAALSVYDSTQYAHFVRQDDTRDIRLRGKLVVERGILSGADIEAEGALRSRANGSSESEWPSGGEGGKWGKGGWAPAGSDFGGSFITHSVLPCHMDGHGITKTNPKTGTCSCPAGFAPVLTSVWRYPEHAIDEFRTYLCLK